MRGRAVPLKASDFGLIPDADADPIFNNSKITRAAWRRKGISPPFIKIGRQIFYRLDNLKTWFEAREARSTAESKQMLRDLRDGQRHRREDGQLLPPGPTPAAPKGKADDRGETAIPGQFESAGEAP